MGRLFWKFFLMYWAATLVVVAAVGTTAWLVQAADEHAFERSIEGGPRATFVVTATAATLSRGGLPALRELLADWDRVGDAPVLVVGAGGRDVRGRFVPAPALARARALATTTPGRSGARLVTQSDKTSYVVFLPAEERGLLARISRPSPPSPMIPISVTLLTSLVFGALIAWYVARPIKVLRAAFERLSRGDLDARVAPLIGGRRDEVADLGRDFDGMAMRIQALLGAQRSLLHDVSHELRSPLARLQAAIGLARQNPLKTEASLERIGAAAQRVDELVAQLLTLSRLEATVTDRAYDRLERVDLVDLLASIAEDAHFEAQAFGKAVAVSADGEVVAEVRGESLHRAFENVVRNAVRFTAAGTTVDVSARPAADGLAFLVSIEDRGPGVPEEELPSIFEPFYRGAGEGRSPGFGLGLAITKRAIEAHGGTVTAANRSGGGLRIDIVVPRQGPQGTRDGGSGVVGGARAPRGPALPA